MRAASHPARSCARRGSSRPGRSWPARSRSRPPVAEIERLRTADGTPLALERVPARRAAAASPKPTSSTVRSSSCSARAAASSWREPTSVWWRSRSTQARGVAAGGRGGCARASLPDPGARRREDARLTPRRSFAVTAMRSTTPDAIGVARMRASACVRTWRSSPPCCGGWPSARGDRRVAGGRRARRVVLVARGSSDYAAIFARYLLEAATAGPWRSPRRAC